jgi:transcriptional regulator EpsA
VIAQAIEPDNGASAGPADDAARQLHKYLDAQQGERLVWLMESSLDVHRRYQFFTWTTTQVHGLAPHRALACGSYSRQHKALWFEPFYTVPLSATAVEQLSQVGGELLRMAGLAWVEGQGRPLALDLDRFPGEAAQREAGLLSRESGCVTLLVHGVARPQRPAEIQTLFVFACPGGNAIAQRLRYLEMIVPTLDAVWLRVQARERGVRLAPAAAEARPRLPLAASKPITGRECEILSWVREGKSNQQIALHLGISPLTVKNHVQRLLHKLGAKNRAQAVAIGMSQNLLGRQVIGEEAE